jgi:hypothetical protein
MDLALLTFQPLRPINQEPVGWVSRDKAEHHGRRIDALVSTRSHNARLDDMEPSPFLRCFEVRGGGLFAEIAAGRGPHQSRCELVRGARSLRLAQRIIIGFVQPLYFAAAEALVADF